MTSSSQTLYSVRKLVTSTETEMPITRDPMFTISDVPSSLGSVAVLKDNKDNSVVDSETNFGAIVRSGEKIAWNKEMFGSNVTTEQVNVMPRGVKLTTDDYGYKGKYTWAPRREIGGHIFHESFASFCVDTSKDFWMTEETLAASLLGSELPNESKFSEQTYREILERDRVIVTEIYRSEHNKDVLLKEFGDAFSAFEPRTGCDSSYPTSWSPFDYLTVLNLPYYVLKGETNWPRYADAEFIDPRRNDVCFGSMSDPWEEGKRLFPYLDNCDVQTVSWREKSSLTLPPAFVKCNVILLEQIAEDCVETCAYLRYLVCGHMMRRHGHTLKEVEMAFPYVQLYLLFSANSSTEWEAMWVNCRPFLYTWCPVTDYLNNVDLRNATNFVEPTSDLVVIPLSFAAMYFSAGKIYAALCFPSELCMQQWSPRALHICFYFVIARPEFWNSFLRQLHAFEFKTGEDTGIVICRLLRVSGPVIDAMLECFCNYPLCIARSNRVARIQSFPELEKRANGIWGHGHLVHSMLRGMLANEMLSCESVGNKDTISRDWTHMRSIPMIYLLSRMTPSSMNSKMMEHFFYGDNIPRPGYVGLFCKLHAEKCVTLNDLVFASSWSCLLVDILSMRSHVKDWKMFGNEFEAAFKRHEKSRVVSLSAIRLVFGDHLISNACPNEVSVLLGYNTFCDYEPQSQWTHKVTALVAMWKGRFNICLERANWSEAHVGKMMYGEWIWALCDMILPGMAPLCTADRDRKSCLWADNCNSGYRIPVFGLRVEVMSPVEYLALLKAVCDGLRCAHSEAITRTEQHPFFDSYRNWIPTDQTTSGLRAPWDYPFGCIQHLHVLIGRHCDQYEANMRVSHLTHEAELTESLDAEQRRLAQQASDRAEARKQKRAEEKALKTVSGAERRRAELETKILEESQFKQKDEKTYEANAALEAAMRVAEDNEKRGLVEDAYNRLTASWTRWVKHDPASYVGVAVQRLRQRLKSHTSKSEAPQTVMTAVSGLSAAGPSSSACLPDVTDACSPHHSGNGSVSKAKKHRKKKAAKALSGSFVRLADDPSKLSKSTAAVEKLAVEVTKVRLSASLVDEASADAERVLAEGGMSSTPATPSTQEMSQVPELPKELECPIELEPLTTAVLTNTGHMYNKDAIQKIINAALAEQKTPVCPMSQMDMEPNTVPVWLVRQAAQKWVDEHPDYY